MRDQGPAGECSLPRGQPQHRGRTKPLPSSALCPQVCPGLAGETQALLPREGHPGSWQGLRDLVPLPREGAALPSCHNPLAHHDIPRQWLPGGSEASSYLDGNATSSEQRPLISLSPPARRLLYGAFPAMLALAQCYRPCGFLPCLQAEQEERARHRAGSTAGCSRQHLLGRLAEGHRG